MWYLFSSSSSRSLQCSEQTREEEEGKLLPQNAGEINEGAMADVEALAAELMALSPKAASTRVSALHLCYLTTLPHSFLRKHMGMFNKKQVPVAEEGAELMDS